MTRFTRLFGTMESVGRTRMKGWVLSLLLLLPVLTPTAFCKKLPVPAAVTKEEDPDCRLWLAPSYLSTESKPIFGVFAGQSGFALNEIIPSYEIAIPVFDYIDGPAAQKSPKHREIIDALEKNTWLADYAGSKFESNSSTSVFIPGIGALPRYHSGISNVDWVQASTLLREPDELIREIKGRPHPSRGAITNYYNATIRATKQIQPGMELFAHYGDSWSDNDPGLYHDKILREDYEIADKLLDKILAFMNTFESAMSDTLQDQILDFMLDNILDGAGGKHAKVIRSLIPAHPAKLQRVKDAGGTFAYRNRDIVQSMEWLAEHGLCIDNLQPGRSTIDAAGRGAFAKRALRKGTIISPVPMHPILNEEILDLYTEMKAVTLANGEEEYVADETKPPTGSQLLVNYCFGHPESSLFLLPMAPLVNLINHGPNSSDVNAILQWSKHDHVSNDHELHDLPLSKWSKNKIRPIVLELVALRDIEQGEEIFIHYGEEWAEAWQSYQNEWNKQMSETKRWPLKALDVRHMYKDKPFPHQISSQQQPYPSGVITACYLETVDDLPDGQARRNAAGQQLLQWLAPTNFNEFSGSNLAVCDLIDRQDIASRNGTIVSYNYTVMTRTKDAASDKLLEVRNVPHAAVTLVERPYSSDIHTPGAFRRWINFEDQKFPQAWRNVRD